MQGYPYEIRSLETDIFGFVPPALLLRACLHGNSLQSEAEELPKERLMRELGAVWMLAKVKIWQSEPIRERDMLELRVSSRGIEGGTYIRLVDIVRGGKTVARGKLVYIVVRLEDRRILRPAAVEEFWNNPRPLSVSEPLKKIKVPENMTRLGSAVIRLRDCDLNGHFSSPNYADIVCEAVGYWEGAPQMMESLQIDFSSELLPGTELAIFTGAEDGSCFVRGVKPDGVTAFTAECVLKRE